MPTFAAPPLYKVVSLIDTNLDNSEFVLPADKIISAIDNGDDTTLMTFLSQDQKVVTHTMNNAIADFYTDCRLRMVTSLDGVNVYIQMDRIILMNVTATGTYIVYHNEARVEPQVMLVETIASAIATNSGGMVLLTNTKTGNDVYVNNLFITMVTSNGTGSKLMFDAKKIEYTPLYVDESPADILTAVNAL